MPEKKIFREHIQVAISGENESNICWDNGDNLCNLTEEAILLMNPSVLLL